MPCQETIGLIVTMLGLGVLVGGLLPSWCIVWILGILFVAIGILLMR